MNAVSFFITSLIIVLIPGTGVIYTISTGLLEGRKKSVFAALGCTAGIIPHLCLSMLMSTFLIHMNNLVYTIIRYAGVWYLLYLGVGMFMSKGNLNIENDISNKKNNYDSKSGMIIRRGILINLLNPKLTLFFLSFLPQYLSKMDENYIIRCMLLGLAFMALTLVVFILYGLLAGAAQSLFINSPRRVRILQKCFGIIFIGFALKVVLNV